jgi:uncharacterized membrane protein
MTADNVRTIARSLLAVVHAALVVAVVAWASGMALAAASPWLVALLALSCVPLLLAVRGLYQDNRETYRWLSLTLVLYVGAACVETIASLRSDCLAIAILGCAVAELYILMILLRGPQSARLE